jgi:hypothetical protein
MGITLLNALGPEEHFPIYFEKFNTITFSLMILYTIIQQEVNEIS